MAASKCRQLSVKTGAAAQQQAAALQCSEQMALARQACVCGSIARISDPAPTSQNGALQWQGSQQLP